VYKGRENLIIILKHQSATEQQPSGQKPGKSKTILGDISDSTTQCLALNLIMSTLVLFIFPKDINFVMID
jgi:hypothetical protein